MSNIAQLLAARQATKPIAPSAAPSVAPAKRGRKELVWEEIKLADFPQDFQDQIAIALAAKEVANNERQRAGAILADILEPGPDLTFRIGLAYGKVSVALDRKDQADAKVGLSLAGLVAKVNALTK